MSDPIVQDRGAEGRVCTVLGCVGTLPCPSGEQGGELPLSLCGVSCGGAAS